MNQFSKKMGSERLNSTFFQRDVLAVAPDILGKCITRRFDTGRVESFVINEVEAYRGADDLACHASKGRTPRTEVMFGKGGLVYVYLIYGMYWMLNFVTGSIDNPQAVLVRGVKGVSGPGRVSRLLEINKSFYGEDLFLSNRIWISDSGLNVDIIDIKQSPRIGIDYAGAEWASKPWRFWCELP